MKSRVYRILQAGLYFQRELISCWKVIPIFLCLSIIPFSSGFSQIIINELSQGASTQEYVELVVVGSPTCANECIDIRGWILDDNNGWFDPVNNISTGAIRFSNDAQWSCVKIGTIIVIYNETSPNPSLPANDETDSNGDCVFILPGNSSYLDRDAVRPNSSDPSYSGLTWIPGGLWDPSGFGIAIMNNSGDAFHLVDPTDLTDSYFAVVYGTNTPGLTDIYFAGSAGGQVYSFVNSTDNDPFNQANWSQATVAAGETPGVGNSILNQNWIDSLSNNCNSYNNLTISNISQVCDWAAGTYTIAFQINNGHPFTYMVSGIPGTITGNQFMSDPISIGTSFSYTVSDGASCGPFGPIIGQGCTASACDQSIGCYGPNLFTGSDFESYFPPSPSFTSVYNYWDCSSGANNCNAGVDMCQGFYGVETSASECNPNWSSNISDHTFADGTGNMMLVDFDDMASQNIWCQTVTLLPSALYCFGGYFLNLLDSAAADPDPIIYFSIDGIQLEFPRTIPNNEVWGFEGVLFNSGVGGTVTLCINNSNFGSLGYDLAIDDIEIKRRLNGSPPTPLNDFGFICEGENSVTVDVVSNDLPSADGLDVSSLNINIAPPFSAGIITNVDNVLGTITFAPEPGVQAATFTYQICDFNGCCEIATVTISQVPAVNSTVSVISNLLCNGDTDGSAMVNPTDGTTPYTYLWDNGETNQSAIALDGGVHSVTVTDANMCTSISTVDILEPAPLMLVPSVINHVTCAGQSDGSAQVTATDGTSPYTYAWSNGQSTLLVTGLASGTYTVTVTDMNACANTTSVTITESAALTASATFIDDASCSGFSDGSASASATGGTGAYTYNWDNGETTAVATGLNAGNHSVTITDMNGCMAQASVMIGEPPPLSPSITGDLLICDGESTTLTATGGSVFLWSNGATTSSITVNPSSDMTYSVTVTNPPNVVVNGGFESGNTAFTTSYVLGNGGAFGLLSDPGDYGIFTSPNIGHNNFASCGDHTSGSGNMLVANGSPVINTNVWCQTISVAQNTAYLFSAWFNGVDLVSPGTTSQFQVTANGVAFAGNFTAPPYSCNNGPWTEYTGTWNSGAATTVNLCIRTISTSTPGNDFALDDISFFPGQNCTGTTSVTVVVNDSPSVNPMTNEDICPGENVMLSASATGGDGNYVFTWDNGLGAGATHTVSPPSTTTYTVTVTDGQMCQGTESITVNFFANPAVSEVLTNVSCFGDNNGSINITETSGNLCPSYNWIGPAAFSSSMEDISGLAPGDYFLTVTGCNNCMLTTSYNISEPAVFDPSIQIDNGPSCNGDSDGQASAVVSGGTAPFTYSWSTGATTSTVTGLGAGPINITVTDSNSCTQTATTNVMEPGVLTATPQINNQVTCFGFANGNVTLNTSGGTPVFTYSWDNGETAQTATGLAPGTHTATVTDANGCSQTASVNITQPSVLSVLTTVANQVSCNGDTDGSAAAVGFGGTTPYTYVWSNGQSGTFTNNLSGGTYIVTVTDANMCTATNSVTLNDPAPIVASAPDVALDCFGDTDGTLTLTVNGGTMPYTFDWDNAPDVQNPSGLGAGTYNVTVTDDNMCSTTTSATIFQPGQMNVSVTFIQDVSCNGGNDGSASVSANGGTTPYTYAWDNGETSSISISLTAGTHIVTVTDAGMCSATGSIVISGPPPFTASALASPASCNGAADGQIDLTVNGGIMPYTYNWNNGAGTNEDPTGLNGGTYSVTVSDANMCTVTASATISEPPLLTLSTSLISDVSCNGQNDGSATVTPSGGTMPYTFAWDNGESTSTAVNLNGGNHIITVTDGANCSNTASILISEPTVLGLSANLINDVTCNGQSNGSASAVASGGTPAYTYNWDNGETTSTATGLSGGAHTLTLTDNNGCQATANVNIAEPTVLSVSATLLNNVTCNGAGDGSASASALGGTPAYTYNWDNGETSSIAISLNGGNHSFTITDANGCMATGSISISEPPILTASASVNNDVSCNGAGDGSATATPGGGIPAYTYSWSNGETSSTATGLSGGTQSLTITDANGCTTTTSVSISEPPILTLSTSVNNNVSCNGASDGSATGTAGGGSPIYMFLWDNGETTATAIGLNGGIHSITVTDDNGCFQTGSVNITEPPFLTISVVVTAGVSCSGQNDGQAAASPSGGNPAYTYNWDNGETSAIAFGLSGGLHFISVTDMNGCIATGSANIPEPNAMSLSMALISDVSCAGAADGSASATPSGGSMPYTYAWDNAESASTATMLPGGLHVITVTDVNGCFVTGSISIGEPSPISVIAMQLSGVTCFGASDGSASASGSGGTVPYTYNWDNGESTLIATGLSGGNHIITVSDNNGCSVTGSVLISEPAALSLAIFNNNNVSCNGASDGSATATPAGGTPGYTFAWDNGETSSMANNLNGGVHGITITDNNGCTVTGSVSISEPALLAASTNLNNDVTCNGSMDGSATVSPSGGTPAYTFDWDSGETTATATNLGNGVHLVTVTDNNGCFITASVSVSEPSLLNSSGASINGVSCNGDSDGSASVSAFGGTPAYTYLWDNGETSAIAISLSGGNHSVTVTDANGCITTNSILISEPSLLVVSGNLISDITCNGSNDGSASVSSSGGSPPYTFSWIDGQTTGTATGLGPGLQSITVSDNNGCSQTASVTISEPMLLSANITAQSDASCFGSSDGSATVSPAGGTTPFTFAWDTGETNSVATMLAAGTHSVTVTDMQGCVASASVSIGEPSSIQVSIGSTTDANCTSCDGSVDISVIGGSTPYTFLWSNGNTTEDPVDLCSGTSAVTVTDANGCFSTANALIGNTSTLVISSTTIDNQVSCAGQSDGQATATPAGGQTPYTFIWTNGQTTSTATGLSAGNYTVTVTDMDGCVAVDNISISEPAVLLALAQTVTNASCNGFSDGEISVLASGGTIPYTYQWSGGQTSSNVSGLPIGAYTVTVTDQNSCQTTSTTTVSEPMPIGINFTIQSDVSCAGGSDGSTSATASGGSPAFTYTWDNGETTSTATGLNEGAHSITVSDSNGCTQTASTIVSEPMPLAILINVINDVNCPGGSDGSAMATVSGGTPGYTYAWDTGETDAAATALNAGTHQITVTDANSCTQTGSISISEPPAFSASLGATTDANCSSCDGTADITLSGGTSPYTFLWSNGNTAEDPQDLCSGSNSVTITDANACQTTLGVLTGNISTLVLDNLVVDNNVSCAGGNDGQASATVSGGQMPYTYAWSDGQSTPTASGLSAGNFTITVTDVDGCLVTGSLTISEPAGLTLIPSVLGNVTCPGGNDGSADVLVVGGTPVYTYLWSNGETSSISTMLSSGTQLVTVTDMNGCSSTTSVNISEPAPIQLSVNGTTPANCTSCDGTADITANGGTGPYTFLWSNGNTNEDPADLCSGMNILTVTDSNGCIETVAATIANTSTLIIDNVSTDANVSCFGANDGAVSVSVLGGQIPYTYQWSNGATDASLTGLSGANYAITVQDADGCLVTGSTIVIEPVALTLLTSSTDETCFGTDGTATVTPSGGTMPYTYLWDAGASNATTNMVTGLVASTYQVTVTDMNGCSETVSVLVANACNCTLTLSISATDASCNGSSDGSTSVIASNGTPPYSIIWDTGSTDAMVTGLTAGSYFVTVSDSGGCSETESVMVSEPSALALLTSVINHVSCNAGIDGSADVTPSGGTMPYTFLWDNAETSSIASSLNAGTHVITLTDANGCTETASIDITEPAVLSLVVDGTTTANCTACDGTAAITVGGGTGPYTFLWSNGNTNEDPIDLCSGGNSLTVTDSQGCTTTANAIVGNTSTLIISSITADNHVSCNGFADGQATVTPSGGQPPYTYNWSNTGTTSIITGLSGGTYSITVTDMDGCIAVDNININEPLALSLITNVLNDVTCNGGSDASAQISTSGGSPVYTYLWSTGGTDAIASMLPAGNHEITVTDANGCVETNSVIISEPSAIVLSATVNNDISCNGASDGSATANTSGGTLPYTFAWSNGETDETATALGPGSHTVTVTDSQSCSETASVSITEPSALMTLIAIAVPVSCAGGSDGSATATPAGGTPAYTYAWDNGETNATATGLNAGTHVLTVTDANGCSLTAQVDFTDPPGMNIMVNGSTAANCTSCDGTADISVSGGFGTYTFLWSNGNTDEDPADLCSGNNDVTVTDSNGCSATSSVVVGNTSSLVIDNIVLDNGVSCNGFSDGQATVTGSGGQPPYTYIWSGGQTDATATGLAGGPANVTLTDSDGCVAVDNILVPEPAALTASAVEDQPVMCFGNSDGQATITASGGTSPYTYAWDNGETNASATNLDAMAHNVVITDSNGCSETASVLINGPASGVIITLDGQTPSNCLSCDGTASVTISGGNLPYTFNWDNGNTSEDPADLCTGFNTLSVTDSDGCISTLSVNIGNTSTLVIDSIVEDMAVSCSGGNDGQATVTASGGLGPYIYVWSNGSSDAIATGLPGGMSSVTVSDQNGCVAAGAISISSPAPIAPVASQVNGTSCFGNSDGSASVSTSGGTMPFTYLWDNTETTASASGLSAGPHSVTVTDANSCSETASVTITEPAAMTASAMQNMGTLCNGDSNGQATATPSGGSMPFTFVWDSGSTNATASNLSGGPHTVTVTDTNGCSATAGVTITEPAVLSATASVGQQVLCNGDASGQATVSPIGGTIPYTYSWDNGETSATATALSAGTHIAIVFDANGCVTTAGVMITEPTALSLSGTTDQNVSCNGGSDGQATVTSSGGTMPYTYNWDNGESTATAMMLNAGTHIITVTDANACIQTTSVVITEPAALSPIASQDQAVACNGGNDGQATVTASGGTMPYTYNWDNGESTATATMLTSGTHLVTVTDSNTCQETASVLITEASTLSTTALEDQSVLCNGDSNGQATASPTGGTMPYTYAWDSGSTNASASNLSGGPHTVSVTDANGCISTAGVTITEPAALTATAVEDQGALCNGDTNGQSTLTVSGGTMPYTYTWDNGESTLTATALAAGTHIAVINDANGCATTAGVIITEPAALSPVASADQNVSCNGSSDGQAFVTTSGGTMPYTFIWDSGEATSTATQLNAGTHLVTVTDANGCAETASVDITEPGVLSPLASQDQAVQCNGDSDGQASVSTSGGTMPYTFNWDSGETLSSATMLNAGTHLVTVTDANGCAETASVLITEPTTLIALAAEDQGVLCFGDANGQATVTAAGGTTTYTYAWDSGSTNASASNLTGGPHTVTVTDANGCIQTASVTISEPALLTATAAQDAAVTCNGGADGQASVSPAGGTIPYTFAWDSGETASSATMLNAGTHLVTVTDANGCAQTATVDITEPGPLGITIVTDQDVQCNGGSDGQATAGITGGTMPFTFAWDNGETTASATMLNAGTHLVTVTDANGCMDTGSVLITEPGVLSPVASQDQAVQCNGGSDGQASVSTTGGTTPYTFAWDSGETISTATQLNAGTHLVTVTDANGCSETASVIIIEPAVLSPVAGQDQAVQCNGGSDGQASVSTSGGTLPYNFAWDSGETTATATALNAGNHLVTVTDANGCAETASVIITEPPVLGLTISSTPVTCFGAIDGQGMATVSGGTPAYTYNWDNGEVSNPAFFLTAGNHVLTVTDQNGCTITGSVTVGSPAPLIPSGISSTPTNCFGGNDGTATAGSTGGTPPYTFNWSNGQSGSVATGLTAGVYQVVISDANGCSLPPISVTVGQPAQSILASVTGTDPLCFGGDDGSLTATATGGTPSYQFTWSNGAVGPTAFGLEAGSYSLTVTDANGCEAIQSFSLDQPEQVSALVSANGTICFDDANGSIVVDTAFGGVGPYIYSLDGQNYQASALFAGLEGGLYEVWVQDINGCESAQDILVEEPFEIVVDLGADVEVVLGDSIRLVADVNTTDTLSYFWSPPQYLSCITCESPVVRPLETTQYTLMVVDTNGCSAVDQILVTVDKSRDVFIPNAFSPNGDGTNDLFMIFSNQGVSQIRMFRVFDRWGEQVFQGQSFQPNDPSFGWDGRMKGKELNPAVFVYFAEIEFVDGVVIMYKGDVTLLK